MSIEVLVRFQNSMDLRLFKELCVMYRIPTRKMPKSNSLKMELRNLDYLEKQIKVIRTLSTHNYTYEVEIL